MIRAREARTPSPTKNKRDTRHWSNHLHESIVSAGPDGLLNLVVKGGGENGQFCYISDIKQDKINYHSGKLHQDDVIVEIQGQKVGGFTLRDLLDWMKHVSKNNAPVLFKTVKSSLLTKDLRQYLNGRFSRGSLDHEQQQTIRDNLYRRTVPCTTREARKGEVHGVDYNFLNVDEFLALEKSGNLLESGLYDGNHYGTPMPPKDPQQGSPFRRTNSMGTLLPGQHPSSEGKRRRNRSNIETTSSPKISSADYPDEASVPPARKKSLERIHSSESLGPLPSNWEMAYTEEGTAYFIDHTTETTHWLDPRLSSSHKKTPLQCAADDGSSGQDQAAAAAVPDRSVDRTAATRRSLKHMTDSYVAKTSPSHNEPELPYGWEKVEDPHYGTYFIDHVNRKTQYVNPVEQAKRMAKEGKLPDSDDRPQENGRQSPPAYGTLKRFFTKNPSELKGIFLKTELMKSPRGFGFTIVGGDNNDEEFLQIKSVVPDGPAHKDGQLHTGDVLVYVYNKCVLGFSHQDVVNMFQGIPIGEQVVLEICRGYPLPFDPDDPNTEIVTTVAVTLPETAPHNTSSVSAGSQGLNHTQRSMKSLPDLSGSSTGSSVMEPHNAPWSSGGGGKHEQRTTHDKPSLQEPSSSRPELFYVHIVKGTMGFGFTIADSAYGQKVKQILDRPRCKTLSEGDILLEINSIKVKDLPHAEVVQILKECTRGDAAALLVQRGGMLTPNGRRKANKSPKTVNENNSDASRHHDSQSQVPRSSHGYLRNSDTTTAAAASSSAEKTADRLTVSAESETVSAKLSPASSAGAQKEDVADKENPTAAENKEKDGGDGGGAATHAHGKPAEPVRTQGQGESRPTDGNIGRSHPPMGSDQTDAYSGDSHSKPVASKSSMSGGSGRQPLTDMQNMAGGQDYPPDAVLSHRPAGYDPYSSTHSAHSSHSHPTPSQRTDYRFNNNHRTEHTMQQQPGYPSAAQSRRDMGHYSFSQFDRAERPDVLRRGAEDPPRREQQRSRTPGPEHMRSREREDEPYFQRTRSKTPTHELNVHQSISGTPDFIPASQYRVRATSGENDTPASTSTPFTSSSHRTDVPSRHASNAERDTHSQRPLSNPDVMQMYQKDSYSRLNSSQSYTNALNYPAAQKHSPTGYTQQRPLSPPVNSSSVQPRKQSTSFEHEEPVPSNLVRPMPRDVAGSSHNRSRSPNSFSEEELVVKLKRQESGFGFRIIGGTEEGSQVSVGHIVPGGAADADGRVQAGDEILSVNGQTVIGSSHHRVVQLMGAAGVAGIVTLGLRKKRHTDSPYRNQQRPSTTYPYDVTVTRREDEGFGFVIISSVTRSGSTIGRIIENSPAERGGRIHVGDRILAVNAKNIIHMHHEDIVNIIKDSGYSVTLTVGPPQDDASSTTTSASQRVGQVPSSQGSMINAMAYPAQSDSDVSRRSDYSPYHSSSGTAPNSQTHDRYPAQTQPSQSSPQPPLSQPSAFTDKYRDSARHTPLAQGDPDEGQFSTVELHRGSRGFGFSIRGGKEFNNMPLYILRIADGSAANLDCRLKVGDQIIEINGFNTTNMTHAEAIDLIQNGGSSVRMLVKRTGKMPPNIGSHSQSSMNVGSMSGSSQRGPSMPNGPVSQSSPALTRRVMDPSRDYYYNQPYSRQQPGY